MIGKIILTNKKKNRVAVYNEIWACSILHNVPDNWEMGDIIGWPFDNERRTQEVTNMSKHPYEVATIKITEYNVASTSVKIHMQYKS